MSSMLAGTADSSTLGGHGWQGPQQCRQYAELWGSIVVQDERRTSFTLSSQRMPLLEGHTYFAIEVALQINQPQRSSKRQGTRAQDVNVDALPLPDIPAYTIPTENQRAAGVVQIGRTRLAMLLKRFACAKPQLGYNPTIASLAAIVLGVIGSERLAFQCLDEIYTRYKLADYFEVSKTDASKTDAVRVDAKIIYSLARTEIPELTEPFEKHECPGLLIDLADHFLRTLLTQAYDTRKQPFPFFVRLIHRLIMPREDYNPKDPRRQLRSVILGIICRHRRIFARCSSDDELKEKCDDLRAIVAVDVTLLKMLDMPLPPDRLWKEALHIINPALACVSAAIACDVYGPLDLTMLGICKFAAFTGMIAGTGAYLCTEPMALLLEETGVLIRRSWRWEIADVDDGEASDGENY
eukprot:TRINITY_DN47920_c0_g1_i1.p1 TRINITY_DN47920_c0_g1~~TRINITY_DN47920_c0_g1_i1.p1  ORF type:complete len:410 (-),score=55.09 TRINITY_DN47920_c0_g1_i1:276-1505(-)